MIIEFYSGSGRFLYKMDSQIDIFNKGDKVLIPIENGKLLFEVKKIMYVVTNDSLVKRLSDCTSSFKI